MRRATPMLIRLLPAWMAVVCGAHAWAQEHTVVLDTLLFTPAQRQAIVQARLGQPQGQAQAQTRATVQQLSGVVRRSEGKGTVWINGQALAEGLPRTPRLVGVDAMVQGRRLRVGQSLDERSGARSDVVAPGAVTVGPPP